MRRAPWIADAIGVAALGGLIALVLARFYAWTAVPSEDAAILMRYAQHLADGHGIVWNVGEAPVDGATDFLFMVAVASLVRLGLGLVAATQALVIGAHIAAVFLVFWRTRRSGFGPGVATLVAGYLAVGPGLSYAEAYFGTPFFAMWAAATFFLAIEYQDREDGPWSVALLLALAALALGLTRPDGVFLAGFIVVGCALSVGRARAARLVTAFVAIYGVLGGAYFGWRWSYFEHPLPNPYYKKGEFHLWVGSLLAAVHTVVRFLMPFVPLYVLALRDRSALREAMLSAVPIVGFTAIWILVSDEMNFLGRFQYAVVPIAVMAAPRLAVSVRRAWALPWVGHRDRRGRRVVFVGGVMLLVALPLVIFRPRLPAGEDGRTVIGHGLAGHAAADYTLATTEAGLLPLLSGWRTIDTWGLNDPWIAHNGGITSAYLDEQDPQVVVVHAAASPIFEDPAVGFDLGPEWDAMSRLLNDWCRERGFTLAAAWGASHANAFWFWVDPECPDHDAIVGLIRDARFDTLGGPGVFVDFARISGSLDLPSGDSPNRVDHAP